MLQSDELKELSRCSFFKSWFYILSDWFLIVGIFSLYIHFSHWWVYLICLVLMARTQLALAILMHDGAHRRLFQNAFTNDYVGQFFTAAPVFFSLGSYKQNHLVHHQDPLVANDPDITLTGGYPISKKSFARKLVRDAVGVSYFKFIKYFLYQAHKRRKKIHTAEREVRKNTRAFLVSFGGVLFSIVTVNTLIFLCLYFSGHPWLYLTLWFVPTVTVLQLLLRIRGVTEHAGYQPNVDQRLNARTVVNPLQTFFFAPHGVNYHIEHHVYPGIPFYNLSRVHVLLRERGALPEKNLYRGYGKVISELMT